ncbi:MAG: hypothetical protein ACM4D3_12120 [Candidatus Sericytochromatia bacterium]
MDIARGALRVVTRTADATTAAAGAVGGAAINGVIGGLQGAVSGIRNGLDSGSHSMPAAAFTLGAIGAAGLVEWPLLLTIGGTALVIHQLGRRSENQPALASVTPVKPAGPRKAAPRKSTASRTSARKTGSAARRTTSR